MDAIASRETAVRRWMLASVIPINLGLLGFTLVGRLLWGVGWMFIAYALLVVVLAVVAVACGRELRACGDLLSPRTMTLQALTWVALFGMAIFLVDAGDVGTSTSIYAAIAGGGDDAVAFSLRASTASVIASVGLLMATSVSCSLDRWLAARRSSLAAGSPDGA